MILLRLRRTGIKVQGTIFEFGETDPDGNRYPVIRFLTQNDEWITGKPKYNIATNFQKIGEKVSIIYDPSNPNYFVNDSAMYVFTNVALGIGGLCMLRGGIAALLNG